MTAPTADQLAALSEREQALLERTKDPGEREVIACSLVAHRRADRLSVGDRIPELSLRRLDGGPPVDLASFAGDRSLVLVFGSFT